MGVSLVLVVPAIVVLNVLEVYFVSICYNYITLALLLGEQYEPIRKEAWLCVCL